MCNKCLVKFMPALYQEQPAQQSCKRVGKYKLELGPNPKIDLNPTPGPKISLDLKMCTIVARNKTTVADKY